MCKADPRASETVTGSHIFFRPSCPVVPLAIGLVLMHVRERPAGYEACLDLFPYPFGRGPSHRSCTDAVKGLMPAAVTELDSA